MPSYQKCAVIDLGSGSARFYIGEVTSGEDVNILHKEGYVHGLMNDLQEHQAVQIKTAEKLRDIFIRWKNIMEEEGVHRYRLAATEAVRAAPNTNELQSILEQSGLKMDVLSHEQEVELSLHMNLHHLQGKGDALFVDSGAASTEMVLVKNRRVESLHPFKIGTATFARPFTQDDRVDSKKLQTQVVELANEIHQSLKGWPLDNIEKGRLIIAGSPVYVLMFSCQVPQKLRDSLEGTKVTEQELWQTLEELNQMGLEGRENHEYIHAPTQGLIPSAIIIFLSLLKATGQNQFVAAAGGLGRGLLLSAANGDGHQI